MNKLLSPFQINQRFCLKNRIIMAPMTRNMADNDLVPTEAMANYYARRADAGLIITEGTIIRPDGRGYSNTPGIFTQAQIDGWKQVTEKVHQQNGLIFCQIWHVGRVSHRAFLNGLLPIGPSETIMSGKVKRADGLHYGKNRALRINEIKQLVNDFATAAENAILAGFDGIEIHAANGYLIDQFLHHSTNLRTDEYGGSSKHLTRFALEIVNACGDKIGHDRIGIRLSPAPYLNEIEEDSRDETVFITLLNKLSQLPIAYVHTGSFDDTLHYRSIGERSMTAFIREYYNGKVIACGSYSIKDAEQGVNHHQFDCVAIGRRFISNPDLIDKIRNQQPLVEYSADMLTTLY